MSETAEMEPLADVQLRRRFRRQTLNDRVDTLSKRNDAHIRKQRRCKARKQNLHHEGVDETPVHVHGHVTSHPMTSFNNNIDIIVQDGNSIDIQEENLDEIQPEQKIHSQRRASTRLQSLKNDPNYQMPVYDMTNRQARTPYVPVTDEVVLLDIMKDMPDFQDFPSLHYTFNYVRTQVWRKTTVQRYEPVASVLEQLWTLSPQELENLYPDFTNEDLREGMRKALPDLLERGMMAL